MQLQASFKKLQQENKDLLDMIGQYRIMFEQSLDAVVLFDSNTCFTEVNQAACQLFELPKENLIGESLLKFLMLESKQKITKQNKMLIEDGFLKGEFAIRVGNGTVKQVEFSARKNDINNTDVSIMRDISPKKILERQRDISKQLFMDVYKQAVDGIVIFDRSGTFINCNKSFMNSFELTKEELLNSTIYNFVEPEYTYKLEKLWTILDEKEKAKGELPVKLKNGVKKVFEFTTTANIFDYYYMSIMRDVTDRKGMEKRLQDSELRFREIFDAALDAIVIWGNGGKVINANSSASKTFEMPIELLTQGSLLDFVDQTSTEVINMNKELKETGKLRAELDFHMVNGQTKRLEFTSRYKVLDDYNMTIFRNVSETRSMEKNLREKEQKFRRIFEGALDGIILWDEDLSIIDVNPVACQILKVSREELLLRRIDQFINSTQDYTLEASQANHDAGGLYAELPFMLENGEERIIEFAVKRNVIPKMNMTIFRDVTERKNIEITLRESEHKFRQLYDNALNGFIIIEDEGNIVNMNPEARRIFGLENEILLPLKLQNFAFINDIEREEKWKQLLGNASLSGQFILNNRIIEYTLSKNIYINNHLAILHDVTERKEMEEKLRKSDTLTIVGELAAGIAHEIRNPMTALKGFIQLLQGNVKEDFSMYFEVITSELKRIESIITEFLILAKPQAVQYQQRDLKKILHETIDLLTPQAALENIQFEVDVVDEDTEIYCEPNQLKQVFINILKNGIEVMPKSGTIHVSIEHHSEKIMRVSFKDEGCGIPEEKIRKLGEPFYTTKERGTGLGLMVSYKIIAEHKGKIEVVSKEGEGTTFHIYLPITQVESE
ncbi:PAS domain S-box protein [Bacillus sp. DJP31]|uniref:PAS domain S-box protein n=1 Tax=Bacillus sp. DJP31 TaxID=3409789 RepID=UPI003BB66AD3